MDVSSPTQRALESADVDRLVSASFGANRRVLDSGPLSGGTFASVWWVTLDDESCVILKTSPPAAVSLLSYERDLLAAEAHYYDLVRQKAPSVIVPRVLHYGSDRTVLDGDWMFLNRLDGHSLADWDSAGPHGDDAPVRRGLGMALASLHAVVGPRFGYSGGRVGAADWYSAFAGMIDELLADAQVWEVDLPVAAKQLMALVERHRELLNLVQRPALLHFDTWDGNVLAAACPDDGLRFTGLVDGERFLFGDPLMDFVSLAIFRRIEDEPRHPALQGYAEGHGKRLALDISARRRLALYRMHLYLLMIVEMPSRGNRPTQQSSWYRHLVGHLDEQLTELGRDLPA